MRILALLALLSFGCSTTGALPTTIKIECCQRCDDAPAPKPLTVARVIDGDTVEMSDGSKVRLIGIDTPERGECGFDEATKAMSDMTLGKEVQLVAGAKNDSDGFGRLLRYVDVAGVDSGLELIKKGLAIARYDSRDGYGEHQREAEYIKADEETPNFSCEPKALALKVVGNKIQWQDGTPWQGKGVNIFDTRSCNACAYQAPDVNEAKRRLDKAVEWGATFVRLNLEAYAELSGRVHGLGIEQDAQYLADIKEIVTHAMTHEKLVVEVSLWQYPTIGELGRPTAETAETWRKLAAELVGHDRVIFGCVNEPEQNYDGAASKAVWDGMKLCVDTIRQVEAEKGSGAHLVAVQGTGGWARLLQYYVDNPIPDGSTVYGIHIYNPSTDFGWMLTEPAKTLPIIIEEFGPWPTLMTEDDTQALITLANHLGVPWTAWSFHQRCDPSILVENSQWGCGIGMDIQPRPGFGQQIKDALSK